MLVVVVVHSRAVLTAVRPDDAADVLREAAPDDAGGNQQQGVEGGPVESFAEKRDGGDDVHWSALAGDHKFAVLGVEPPPRAVADVVRQAGNVSSDDNRRPLRLRARAGQVFVGSKPYAFARLGPASYLLLFLATSVAPVLLGVPKRLGVPLGLALALIALTLLLSRKLRAGHPTDWSKLSAADALSLVVAIFLTTATIHYEVGGGGFEKVLVPMLEVLILAAFFLATVPRLEGLLSNLTSVEWSARKGVTVPQALAGRLMIRFFKAIAKATNAIAVMIALLSFAFTFDGAPAWTQGALTVALLVFLRWYEARRRDRAADMTHSI